MSLFGRVQSWIDPLPPLSDLIGQKASTKFPYASSKKLLTARLPVRILFGTRVNCPVAPPPTLSVKPH